MVLTQPLQSCLNINGIGLTTSLLNCVLYALIVLGQAAAMELLKRPVSVTLQDTIRQFQAKPGLSTPGNVTKLTDDGLFQGQIVWTKFTWPAVLGGEEVYIWGSFNDWTKGVRLHKAGRDRDAVLILPLQPGTYEFKFVVDKVWTPAPHEPTVTNAEGHLNNYRVIAPTVSFSIKAPRADNVFVVGDWDSWQYSLVLKKDPATGTFTAKAHLPPGQYSYSFLVDGTLSTDPAQAVHPNEEYGEVHRTWSFEPNLFRIFYCTGWDEAVLQYRRVEWQRLSLVNAPSRGNSLGVWKMATIVPTDPSESLEFTLNNGAGGDKLKEDRPGSAPLYVCPFPGSFKLAKGMLRPFPRGAESRIMLVSDIDGTMIGDMSCPDAFSSSHRFAEYWENSASLAGSLLVYNTGRSLGQFVDLMKKCDGKLAIPDVVITAVGTKVWHLDETCGRCAASGLKWIEDLMAHFNDEATLCVLDDGSEHRHRIALTADVRVLEYVMGRLMEGFQREKLEVRIITSGNGSHRYIDCVPVSAGKEKALQYVRKHFGVPEHLCVAAGDSGNDILMLEGDHPAIVVGNAQPELLQWLVRQQQSGKVIYADACYADGILEGLARHSLY
ncbi:hypothetical protein VOLCADRAFT_119992 [Volvox carteri f. nagariensis]|uniref:Sucrose phosphatase-like domain-containing protein n=1 Tax=Volvox carteri f. nagariensis TaxID=3068 RepID=D8UIW3_VOLCA|nr:uncharacterized protein VOLCADRAFT_119992 [Volvox carteri f. nagariensis]EFJ40325.1 hypothetical protein VOLCADRAFT_119992 [Volvox carteri f. nagariensis]|eukprot:XP_002958588.1 hypothetical protein VOLCADRAFT_119992 [Volvox carteri f. nagariensis]